MYVMIIISLLDGSNVTLKVPEIQLNVQTKHGLLKMPIKDVNFIVVGIHVEESKRFIESINDLGHPQHKVRDLATSFLMNNPRGAWKYLPKEHEDLEVQKRIKKILDSYNERPNLEDIITIGQDVFSGEIQQKEIEGVSESLGNLKIKLSQINRINIKNKNVKTVIDKEEWTTVGQVTTGRVSITVKGSIDLWPQVPGQYLASIQVKIQHTLLVVSWVVVQMVKFLLLANISIQVIFLLVNWN